MKLELHITETLPEIRYVTGVSRADAPNPFHPGPGQLHMPCEPDLTVVQLTTDNGMSSSDVAALLRSVANSLSPRNPQETS